MACMCNYNSLVRSLSVAVLETMTNEFSNSNLIRGMCPLSVCEEVGGGRSLIWRFHVTAWKCSTDR